MTLSILRNGFLSTAFCVVLTAGGLRLEVGSANANSEAKALGASLVARVVACKNPAVSTVRANLVRFEKGGIVRTPLKVVQLANPEFFAVIGATGSSSALEMTVTNPEFGDYQNGVLLRVNTGGIEWGSLKQLWGKAATTEDLRATIGS